MELSKSVLGGMMICIASTLYIAIDNHIIGAIMFAFGLLTVFELKLNLLTGKAVDYHQYSPSQMISFFFGNFIGCAIFSLFVLSSTKSILIKKTAQELCLNKYSNGIFELFCSGVLCGILMAIAVRINKLSSNNVAKTFIIIICITVFILIGGEHCIADVSYMMLGRFITFNSIIKLFFIVIGNVFGSVIVGNLYGYNKDKETSNLASDNQYAEKLG